VTCRRSVRTTLVREKRRGMVTRCIELGAQARLIGFDWNKGAPFFNHGCQRSTSRALPNGTHGRAKSYRNRNVLGITLMVDGKMFRQCERRIEAQKRQQTRGISKFVSRPSNLCAPRLPLRGWRALLLDDISRFAGGNNRRASRSCHRSGDFEQATNDSVRSQGGGQTEGHGEHFPSPYFAGREPRAECGCVCRRD
jgi:hypothetical protein